MTRIIDWSDLEELYINQKLDSTQIGKIKGCDGAVVYKVLRRLGIKTRTRGEVLRGNRYNKPKKGADSPWWRGGKRHIRGYIQIRCPGHPYAGKNGYVYEHRLVMEEKLGRYLLPSEKVHHINGIKDDNRPENLQVFSCQAEHLTTIVSVTRLDALELKVKELEKTNRLLLWHIKEINKQLQLKLEVDL
ncbi:MAG: HNH endonuclease [Dehalococcoidales bacterium]|jgi:hypothetical protein|nr:HNH endonuclease [Dehalococcoidales bacterium]